MNELLKLIEEGIGLASQAKVLGAIGTLAVLLKLLVDFSKTKFGQSLLAKISGHYKWIRPVIACVLGFLAGALSALALHKPWLSVLMAGLAGIGAGLAGVGGHELISLATTAGREKRAAAGLIDPVLKAGDADVEARVEAVKADLDKVKAITGAAERRKALAAFANAHAPKPA